MSLPKIVSINPINGRHVVRPIKREDVPTRGGIFLPEAMKEDGPIEGRVICASWGRILDGGGRAPSEVEAGSRILFYEQAGVEVESFDGSSEKCLLVSEKDILAILVEAPH